MKHFLREASLAFLKRGGGGGGGGFEKACYTAIQNACLKNLVVLIPALSLSFLKILFSILLFAIFETGGGGGGGGGGGRDGVQNSWNPSLGMSLFI